LTERFDVPGVLVESRVAGFRVQRLIEGRLLVVAWSEQELAVRRCFPPFMLSRFDEKGLGIQLPSESSPEAVPYPRCWDPRPKLA
jgi:hypothetical protein